MTAATVPGVAAFERAGLFHRKAPDAAERLNLLRLVAARGGSLAAMKATLGDEALERLAAELFFLPSTGRQTVVELASTAGVAVDEVCGILRACGLPVPDDADRSFTAADADLVRGFLDATSCSASRARFSSCG